MKTRILPLFLALSLLLSCLAACGGTGEAPEPAAESAETEPDYSWFTMPEEPVTVTVKVLLV